MRHERQTAWLTLGAALLVSGVTPTSAAAQLSIATEHRLSTPTANVQELLSRIAVAASLELPLLNVDAISDAQRAKVEHLEAATRVAMLKEARVLRTVPWKQLQVFDFDLDALSAVRVWSSDRAQTDRAMARIAALRTAQLTGAREVLTDAQRAIFDANVVTILAAEDERERFFLLWQSSQITGRF